MSETTTPHIMSEWTTPGLERRGTCTPEVAELMRDADLPYPLAHLKLRFVMAQSEMRAAIE